MYYTTDITIFKVVNYHLLNKQHTRFLSCVVGLNSAFIRAPPQPLTPKGLARPWDAQPSWDGMPSAHPQGRTPTPLGQTALTTLALDCTVALDYALSYAWSHTRKLKGRSEKYIGFYLFYALIMQALESRAKSFVRNHCFLITILLSLKCTHHCFKSLTNTD